MAWYWRRSKQLGPFRLTASKTGVSLSAGGNSVYRKTINTHYRRKTTTFRIPGTGVSRRTYTKLK